MVSREEDWHWYIVIWYNGYQWWAESLAIQIRINSTYDLTILIWFDWFGRINFSKWFDLIWKKTEMHVIWFDRFCQASVNFKCHDDCFILMNNNQQSEFYTRNRVKIFVNISKDNLHSNSIPNLAILKLHCITQILAL